LGPWGRSATVHSGLHHRCTKITAQQGAEVAASYGYGGFYRRYQSVNAYVPLASVMHALSDPTRLAIVRRLNDDLDVKGEGLACNCAVTEALPRATMSNHFTVLRSSGLIESRKRPATCFTRPPRVVGQFDCGVRVGTTRRL